MCGRAEFAQPAPTQPANDAWQHARAGLQNGIDRTIYSRPPPVLTDLHLKQVLDLVVHTITDMAPISVPSC